MEIKNKNAGLWRLGVLFLLGWYLFELALHYFLQRPLWNDELCILYNIEHLSKSDFFSHSLYRDQAFPRFYLYLIRFFSGFYHHSVLSLRFFPLISMLAAFFVWAVIARRELKERAFFLFIFSWVSSGMLVYYAAELKQYSLDVLVAGLFLLFLQRQRELSFGKVAVIFCLLPILGIFSYTAFFFLIFIFWNLFILAIKDIRFRYVFSVCVVVSLTVFSIVYYFDLRLTDRALIAAFPQYFVSIKSAGAFFKTLTEGVNNLISRWFVVKPLWLRFITRFYMTFGMLELFMGFGRKFKEDQQGFYSVGDIAPVLFLELILLSIVHIFPFRLTRAVLFFCPILFFLTVQFFMRLEEKWKVGSFFLQSTYACFLFYMALWIMWMAIHGSISLNLSVSPHLGV